MEFKLETVLIQLEKLTHISASFFLTLNSGQKLVTLKFQDAHDLAKLHGLPRNAFLIVEKFRDETLAKIGLEPEFIAVTNLII